MSDGNHQRPSLFPGMRNSAAPAVSLAVALLTASCADWVSRRESIGFAAGDAVAANKVLQIIDPWDSRAAWTDIDQDGNRAAAAVDAYRAGGDSGDSDSGTDSDSGQSMTQ